MINNVSFKQTIIDQNIKRRMIIEQSGNYKTKPLVTELVKKLNEETEKTGDLAYLSSNDSNYLADSYYGMKNFTLEILKKDGTLDFANNGTIDDKKGIIKFNENLSRFNVTI